MWSRESLVEAMAAGLWEEVGTGGDVPKNVHQAGEDLARLYEEANDTDLPTIARRIHEAAEDADDVETIGFWLAGTAMGASDMHEVDALSDAGLGIPTFSIEAHRHGGKLEVVWEGSPARRNPRRRGFTKAGNGAVLLLEDDPALQAATGRWLRKMYPGIKLLVADNVDAAIDEIQNNNVTLIVSDVDVVGNKSGIDLFHYVKSNRPELVDHYVFFTGNSAAAAEHYRYVAKGGATRADLQDAIDAPRPNPARRRSRDELSTSDVAEIVREVIPTVRAKAGPDGRPATRFGDRKVFISALWRSARDQLNGMSIEQFKKALLVAHRERLLTLARADLVSAMDSGAVAASRLSEGGADFHFVVDPSVGQGGHGETGAVVDISPAPARQTHARASSPSLDQLVAAVYAALPQVKQFTDSEGRIGGRWSDKVFISQVWAILSPQFPDLTRGMFDYMLLEANRAQMIDLRRLDSRSDAYPPDRDQSEIQSMGATFHFIIDRNADPLGRR